MTFIHFRLYERSLGNLSDILFAVKMLDATFLYAMIWLPKRKKKENAWMTKANVWHAEKTPASAVSQYYQSVALWLHGSKPLAFGQALVAPVRAVQPQVCFLPRDRLRRDAIGLTQIRIRCGRSLWRLRQLSLTVTWHPAPEPRGQTRGSDCRSNKPLVRNTPLSSSSVTGLKSGLTLL